MAWSWVRTRSRQSTRRRESLARLDRLGSVFLLLLMSAVTPATCLLTDRRRRTLKDRHPPPRLSRVFMLLTSAVTSTTCRPTDRRRRILEDRHPHPLQRRLQLLLPPSAGPSMAADHSPKLLLVELPTMSPPRLEASLPRKALPRPLQCPRPPSLTRMHSAWSILRFPCLLATPPLPLHIRRGP